MNLKEEFTFLYNLSLNVTFFFSKDYKKCYKGFKDYNVFIIISKLDKDKLHY
jgi:hypothetical protein